MKHFSLLLIALGFAVCELFAARMAPVPGRVTDEQGNAVEFATVVLLRNDEQISGMATDTEGRFELKVPTGDYTLRIQYIGYEPVVQPVRVSQNNDLGVFVLKTSATQIEGVTVKAQLIRREADRFVVNVANNPASSGKNGVELLENAPGVWVTDDKISINGKSGSKVLINDRELKMDTEQLLSYLRALRAEDIQKIEVIPVSGADYDADTASGIIKITLKKRREDGLEGSLTFETRQSELQHAYSPNTRINYHRGSLDLYASGWAWIDKENLVSKEKTVYTSNDTDLASHSKMVSNDNNGGFSIGTIYELNDRHSIGGEFGYMHNSNTGPNDTYTDFTSNGLVTRTKSRYDASSIRNNYEATFNYIWKIDTLGSTFKVLADYTHRGTDSNNDNSSRITAPNSAVDSLFRDNTFSKYNIASATLALEKKFSPRWTLKAGAKYTYNDMRNNALYEYRKEDAWMRNDNQSFRIDYTENIAAAYGIVSANLGRWSVVAGLRGEYTRTNGKGGDMTQDYLSLFPNANISYSLSKDGAYSIVAQYARTISRPWFWALTPQRMQISDYTYQTGNPELDPSFKHDVSLTLILKHKYSITAGLNIVSGEIQQTMLPDADDPDRLCLTWLNFDRTTNYYVTANLPFQFTKWWTFNANATYVRQGQRVEQHGKIDYFNALMARGSMGFTLPAKFYLEVSYAYSNRMHFGNCWVEPQHRLEAGVKKYFGDKLHVWIGVQNLLDQGQTVGAQGNGFVRNVKVKQPWNNRVYKIGLSYNFKTGKAFRNRSVEASSEDKSRL